MIVKINGVPIDSPAYPYCGNISDSACGAKLAFLNLTYGHGFSWKAVSAAYHDIMSTGHIVLHKTYGAVMGGGHEYLHSIVRDTSIWWQAIGN